MDELEQFLLFWLGPRHDEHGEPEETLRFLELPEPLRRLYAFAGRWPSPAGGESVCEKYGWVSLFSTQDMLLRPSHLTWTPDGRVQFLCENQNVWSLITCSTGDDPPVWKDEEYVGLERCQTWPKVHESLAQVLTTFCLQELTFGARFGVWDDDLTRHFRSGRFDVTPLRLNGPYVYPGHCHNFYLWENDVLVMDNCDSDPAEACFFGANSESGVARIQAFESPIVSITVSLQMHWTAQVHQDGSGTFGGYMGSQPKAVFPPGTFDFAALLADILSAQTGTGSHGVTPVAFFHRSGRGYAEGKCVHDLELVRRLLNKAAAVANGPQKDVQDWLRSRPLEL